MLSSAPLSEMAPRSPDQCSCFVVIHDLALLRLRFQPRCGLDPDPDLPFLDGHELGPPLESGCEEAVHLILMRQCL